MNEPSLLFQTTPRDLTREIYDFCGEIDAKATPVYVAVKADRSCIPWECYQNVRNNIRKLGGREQQGWIIWTIPTIHLEAEHHAVWVSPRGELIDITPQEDGEERILFLPSSLVLYDGSELIAPVHKPLTNDSVYRLATAWAIEAFKEKNEAFKQGRLTKPSSWKEDFGSLKVGRNDFCPCGSGRKFKKCCMN